MAEEVIGKVSATEKNPSTINEFYFWTKAGYKLSPFDVIKVEHIENSTTFGVIEEICHVTDSSSHLRVIFRQGLAIFLRNQKVIRTDWHLIM